jgi:hypothetical protein
VVTRSATTVSCSPLTQVRASAPLSRPSATWTTESSTRTSGR